MDTSFTSHANPLQYDAKASYPEVFKNGETISTQLPRNIALTRIGLTIALTIFYQYASDRPVWRWSVRIAGASFTGYTVYAHLLRKDPLVEAFYKIVGGEKAFNALPELSFDDQDLYYQWRHLPWNQLQHPAYRAQTLDGRKILIIKAQTFNVEVLSRLHRIFKIPSDTCNTNLFLVEKLGPGDLPRLFGNVTLKNSRRIQCVLHALSLWMNNSFCKKSFKNAPPNCAAHSSYDGLLSHMPAELANAFHSQLTASRPL
jgi:hypothetical protein